MQLAILISGVIGAILFIVSAFAFVLKWGSFKIIALAFLAVAILTFILMIFRNIREEWKIGGKKQF